MIKRIVLPLLIISIIILSISVESCKKESFTSDNTDLLSFSKDTVNFDTVFSSIGSSTKHFLVKNTHKSKSIKIDKIFLAKGKSSKYRLNIDGFSKNSIEDFRIRPNDSVYIFVEVTIDPGKDAMIEKDSVIFQSNGNSQNVKLISFGQDVSLLNAKKIEKDTVWSDTKPILIYNSALIESDVTVTVNAGTRVYFHKNSSLIVKGTLIINGELDNRVLFTGDRLEKYYDDIPGQWGATHVSQNGSSRVFGGIHLLPGSKNNVFKNLDLKNSLTGVEVDSCVTPGIPSLKLINVNIENSKINGLLALDAHIEAENCVFANSGKYNLACLFGGKYRFIHCTMANYYLGSRKTAQLRLNNFYESNGALIARPIVDAYFGNCIIYGNNVNEIDLNLSNAVEANFCFDNCIIRHSKSETFKNSPHFIDNIFNEDPMFVSTKSPFDYQLDEFSPAIDKAKISISNGVPQDQKGKSRFTDSRPDLGAFERE